jgi:predicted signal transduction protein with EAL and GGDEF domain
MDRIRSTLAACGHNPTLTFAVIYLDLDGFKSVNDTMGHAAGDALLVAVARRLSDTVRILGRTAPDAGGSAPRRAPGTDTLARVGGDEFVVLLNHTRNDTNALAAATRILSAINTPFAIEGREVTISASVGVAVGPGQYTGADPLVRDADVAMYRAKAAGRSQIKMFDPTMQAEASRQMVHRGQLRAAVARQDFVVLFQPIVCVEKHRLQGFEALLRWRHEGTLVPPADFLPLAEETGLIVSLGRWAMEQACRQARVWRAAHPDLPAGLMTINVSHREMADGEFLTHLGRAVSEAGIDPTDLRIELTESVALQDPAHALALIRQLRLRGHRVSMDGFGVGHSLLSWFDQLPFDGFKLDGSFVRNLDTSARSLNVVRLVVELAKEGGIELVAEGVESERQVEILRTLGCTLHQGYFFAEPQEAAQLDQTFVQQWT